jgi:hypothetical protein
LADLVQTPASVLDAIPAVPDHENTPSTSRAGVAILAGNVLYADVTAAGVQKLATAAGTAAQADVSGIALCNAAVGQPVVISNIKGNINLGATLVVGTEYVLSATPGAICPRADLVSTNKIVVLGNADAANNLKMRIDKTLIAVP